MLRLKLPALILTAVLLVACAGYAQGITIDGNMAEGEWDGHYLRTVEWQASTGKLMAVDVYATSDDEYLYVAWKAHTDKPQFDAAVEMGLGPNLYVQCYPYVSMSSGPGPTDRIVCHSGQDAWDYGIDAEPWTIPGATYGTGVQLGYNKTYGNGRVGDFVEMAIKWDVFKNGKPKSVRLYGQYWDYTQWPPNTYYFPSDSWANFAVSGQGNSEEALARVGLSMWVGPRGGYSTPWGIIDSYLASPSLPQVSDDLNMWGWAMSGVIDYFDDASNTYITSGDMWLYYTGNPLTMVEQGKFLMKTTWPEGWSDPTKPAVITGKFWPKAGSDAPLGWPGYPVDWSSLGVFSFSGTMTNQVGVPSGTVDISGNFGASDNKLVLKDATDSEIIFAKFNTDVKLELWRHDMSALAAGYQAFINYDESMLGSAYTTITTAPYGLLVHENISGGDIILAAIQDVMNNEQVSTNNAKLADLSFTTLEKEGITQIVFRQGVDSSGQPVDCYFTDDQGYEIRTQTVDGPIIIIDGTDPAITAPKDVTVNTDPGACTASNVDLGTPTTSDNFSGVASITNNAPAVFPKGETTVTWTVTDKSGNSATATQKVTVVDNEKPTIIAPDDIIANTDAGKCYATIADIGTATANDNCPDYVVTVDNPVTDDKYPKGVTVITYTVTDASGNKATDTQTITVYDKEAPKMTKGTIDACYASVEAAEAAAVAATRATDNCDTPTVTAVTVGTCRATIKVKAADTSGNSSYVTYYTRIDGEAPVLTVPADISVNADAGLSTAAVDPGMATATDNCTGTYFDGFEDANWEPELTWFAYGSSVNKVVSNPEGITAKSGDFFGAITPPATGYTGTFTRLGGFTKTFGSGFKASLDVYIDLSDLKVADGTYGWDLSTAVCNQNGEHRRDFVFHVAAYGPGKVYVAASNNSNSAPRKDLESLDHAEITESGWYTFEWNFRDDGSGVLAVDFVLRNATANQVWTNTRSNASDLIDTVVGGNGYMWFTFLSTDYLAIDNASLNQPETPVVTGARSDGKALGDPYPIGDTTITWTANDRCGNTSAKTQTVTVKDKYTANVTLQIEGAHSGSTTRIVALTFGSSGGDKVEKPAAMEVEFTNGVASFDVDIPVGYSWTCISAKDLQHTLRKQASMGIVGTEYKADITLIGGDLTNDNLVDILDFGVFAGQFGDNYKGPYPFTQRDADITGDGLVTSAEFTFIQSKFLQRGDAECTAGAGGQAAGQTSIGLIQMAREIGMQNAIASDQNMDRVIDMKDVNLFIQRYLKRTR